MRRFGCKVARCRGCGDVIRLWKPKLYCSPACGYRMRELARKWGMTMDLFETVAQAKRERLQALGWKRLPRQVPGLAGVGSPGREDGPRGQGVRPARRPERERGEGGRDVIYLDENGAEMTVEAWRDEFKRRGHVPIMEHDGKTFSIRTYWVGICGKNEDPPRPFLVEFNQPGEDGKPAHRSYWCASRATALERHTKCCSKIRSRKLR